VTTQGRTAVLVWLMLLAGSGYWLTRHLAVTTDLSAFLPAAASPAQQILIGQLRNGIASRLLLLGIDGNDARTLARASEQLAQRLDDSGQFMSVSNGAPSRLLREQQLLFSLRYVLSPDVTPQRFSAEGLRQLLEEGLELLASPLGMAYRQNFPADPTGEMHAIIRLHAGTGVRPEAGHGAWLTADGRRALLVAETRAAGFEIDAQEQALDAIRQAYSAVATPDMQLQIAGPGLAASVARTTIRTDAVRASLLSAAAAMLILFSVYRAARPVALSALPALSGMVAGVTAVGLWFGEVHGITLAFGAILIGEAIDYPTYLYTHAARGEAAHGALSRVGATLRLAVLTTACGALAMLLSSFDGLAQLGLLLVSGVLTAGLVTRWVLPALTPTHILSRKRDRLPLDVAPFLAGMRGRSRLAAALLAAAAAVIALKQDRLWDDNLENLSPVPTQIKTLDASLRRQIGAPDVRHLVVVTGADHEQALEKSERIAVVLERAVAEKWITGYDLAARYLPSRRTQELRRAALPDSAILAANLRQAMTGLPFRADLFKPFLADVERARNAPWLNAQALQGSALGLRLETLLLPAATGWAALAPLSGVRDPQALDAALMAHGVQDVLLLDIKRETDTLVAGYRSESLKLFSFGLLCIAVLVLAGLRSLAMALRVLVPALGAAMLSAATLVAAGTGLTLFHMVALLLVVGIGINYALFFNRPARDGDEHALTLLALAAASLTTLCAALALALSGAPVLRAIGTAIALGTVYALILSILLSRDGAARDGNNQCVS
jgi:predicted exporter